MRNFTGFGLYDRVVMDKLREIDDPYPYFRGLICDLGYARVEIPYAQPARRARHHQEQLLHALRHGDAGDHQPLQGAAAAGGHGRAFCAGSIIACSWRWATWSTSCCIWNSFQVGVAPLVIGVYFFGSVQLFFIGILGEYIGSIHTQVYHRPLVIEKERINFDCLQQYL